jgi:hypothetical protein
MKKYRRAWCVRGGENEWREGRARQGKQRQYGHEKVSLSMVVTGWVKMSGEMVNCRQGKTRETERQ